MKKLFMMLSIMGIIVASNAQETSEEKPVVSDIKRPKDAKLESFDAWKNSVFDLYENMMAVKEKADADADYDAATELKSSTGELILLAGQSILMVKEAKKAPALKKAKAIPAATKCTRALTMCKRYAKQVLGDDVSFEEETEDGR